MVKVEKCDSSKTWYSDFIGCRFKVERTLEKHYQVYYPKTKQSLYIKKTDCQFL